jgi:hypothetical protein
MHFICPSIQAPPKRWQSALVIGPSDIEGVEVPESPDGALPGGTGGVLVPLTSLPVVPLGACRLQWHRPQCYRCLTYRPQSPEPAQTPVPDSARRPCPREPASSFDFPLHHGVVSRSLPSKSGRDCWVNPSGMAALLHLSSGVSPSIGKSDGLRAQSGVEAECVRDDPMIITRCCFACAHAPLGPPGVRPRRQRPSAVIACRWRNRSRG